MKKKKMSQWVLTQGGGHCAPLWPLTLFSEAGPGRGKSHDQQKGGWRSNDKVGNLKQWLLKTKTGKLRGSTAVTRMFDKNTKQYAKNMDQTCGDEESIMGDLTIGHFLGNNPKPNSLMWQWRGEELHHWFLYGRVDSGQLWLLYRTQYRIHLPRPEDRATWQVY